MELPESHQIFNISNKIPERDLILMFPFTYVNYRIMEALCFDPRFLSPDELECRDMPDNRNQMASFKAFLEALGPVPEDTGPGH